MARLRIAVSLGNVPQLLRTIVLKTLNGAPDIDVAEYLFDDPEGYDALIVSGQGPVDSFLKPGRVGRVIDIEPDGKRASVHWLRRTSGQVEELSPERLLDLVTRRLPERSDRKAMAGRRFWPLFRRLGPQPPALPAPDEAGDEEEAAEVETEGVCTVAPVLPDDAIGRELARLAARYLAARGGSPRPQNGPGGELFALARKLATAGGGSFSVGLPGLERIKTLFELSEDERDLLFLAAVVEVEPQAARLVALLNDHLARPRPTVGLIEAFGGDSRAVAERLAGDGPLRRFDLVRLEGDGPIATRSVSADAAVWPLLFGMQRRPPFTIEPIADVDLAGVPLPDKLRAVIGRASSAIGRKPAGQLAVLVVGDAEVGRRGIARALAGRLRRNALLVSGTALQSAETVGAIARETIVAEAAVILTEPESCGPGLWQALTSRLSGPLFAVTEPDKVAALALASARPLMTVQAPPRDRAQRLRLWTAQAPADWPPEALGELAERFGFGDARIASSLSLARTRAEAEGRKKPGPEDARAAAEILRDTHFGSAAERLDCPFERDDIVLREETERELGLAVAWANHGARLFCNGGPGASLHAGGGLACLFTGPPGTGKTMAAQIIAREIDYTLFRIDLAQVVDKYIGESEKRLSAVFEEAERSRVALFFDEADALFGKRTEVKDSHDRYANIAVDHLLQKLEDFQGLAILASNLAANIDPAFLRRIRIRADFPAPGPEDRRRIWEKLLPEPKHRAGDIDIPRLADPFELVGGEIRNAVYTAHLLAAMDKTPIAMRHCVAGLSRELGKTGRISDLAQLAPWRDAAAGVRAIRFHGAAAG